MESITFVLCHPSALNFGGMGRLQKTTARTSLALAELSLGTWNQLHSSKLIGKWLPFRGIFFFFILKDIWHCMETFFYYHDGIG